MDKTIGLIKKCDNLELRQKNKAGYLNKVLAAYLRYWLGRETPAQRSLTNEKRKANEPPPALFLSLKHTHTDMLSLSLLRRSLSSKVGISTQEDAVGLGGWRGGRENIQGAGVKERGRLGGEFHL